MEAPSLTQDPQSTKSRQHAATQDPKPAKSLRNTAAMVGRAVPILDQAVSAGLMHVTLQDRANKRVRLDDGRVVTEFINCSYLGLDLHPAVLAGAKQVLDDWGIHLCCARSRFSIGPNALLEDGLSALFRGRAITFPSVTSTHMSVLPLLASGVLLDDRHPRPMRVIFDRFAHASMQYLKPILAEEAQVCTIPHNDLDALRSQVQEAHACGQRAVYLADGVYSMGGMCPVTDLIAMAQELDFALYIDDAHGTSIFGEQGEGYVLSQIQGPLPEQVFVCFSLAKGFGCNGGGIVLPNTRTERLIRQFGQTYNFSAPLDFSLIGGALAALELHRNGEVRRLQTQLDRQIALFVYGEAQQPTPPLVSATSSHLILPNTRNHDVMVPFLTWNEHDRPIDGRLGPIRMVFVGEEARGIDWGQKLIERGYFVSAAFFPVVPRGRSQLRIAITAGHDRQQILGLRDALRDIAEASGVLSAA